MSLQPFAANGCELVNDPEYLTLTPLFEVFCMGRRHHHSATVKRIFSHSKLIMRQHRARPPTW